MNAVLRAFGLAWGHVTDEPLGCGLDVTLMGGEMLAVVGPNGAGKSTLLLTLGGQISALGGRVELVGADVADIGLAERARRVAVLPQDIAPDPELTVRELVELGRTPHLGLWGRLRQQDHDAVDQALLACDLQQLKTRRLGQLSGGERQRALIALAMAQGAPLLLLDEPTTHLDLRRRAELFALLTQLRQRTGVAVVMVLHELADAFSQSTRVLVLGRGSAVELKKTDPQLKAKLAQAFEVDEQVLVHLRLSEAR